MSWVQFRDKTYILFFKWQAQTTLTIQTIIDIRIRNSRERGQNVFTSQSFHLTQWFCEKIFGFFFHFRNHNDWFSLVFPLQYSLKEIEKNLSLVLQNYKLRYSWKFSWARKSCPKISLVFQKLGRSLEKVEFSVSEQFIVGYQKTICGLTIIFFSGIG